MMLSHALKSLPFHFSVSLYFIQWPEDATLDHVVFKLLPILLLIAFVIIYSLSVNKISKFSIGIMIGLIFSILGDYFLVYHKTYFLHGAAAFVLAQIIYGITFGLRPLKLPILLICILCGSAMYIYLYPRLTPTYVPIVAVYVIVIYFMAWRALSRFQLVDGRWTWGQLFCALGAISFLISDFALGVNKFHSDVENSKIIIMGTYYAAQFGITMSITDYESKRGRSEKKIK